MSNQPAPTRPWFRLASLSRPAPQEPSPTPEPAPAPPRPATVRPAFRPAVQGVSSVPTSPVGRAPQPSSPADKKPATSSVPSSPVKTVPTVAATAAAPTTAPPKTAKTASLPSSPAKPAVTATSVPPSPAKTVPTTTSVTSSPTQKPASPVTTTTRVPSPKPPTARPPSPLTLPTSLLKAQAELETKIPAEAEQKTVLVQTTIDKPKGYPQKDLGDTRKPSISLNGQKEPSKDSETKEKVHGKKFSSDSKDDGMRVITIAGDNKGAFMEIIQPPHKNGFQGSHYRLQKKTNASRTEGDISNYQSYSSSSEEGYRKMKDKSNSSKTMPMNAFMNSNVQSINNSIVFNSSCTLHDPGVHLTLYRKPTLGGFHVKERTSGGYNS